MGGLGQLPPPNKAMKRSNFIAVKYATLSRLSFLFPPSENVQVAGSVGSSFWFLVFINKARAEPLGTGNYLWVPAM